MKTRNKGKVYPSSSSSSSPSPPPPLAGDSLSALNLLPAAILSLAVVLSIEDREVLAYMITRSIKSSSENKKKTFNSSTHKPPVFDCDCFDCYTSYWFKWDTSPNRELIHQAIEAFEENLSNSEQSKKKGKKKEKMSHRRLTGKSKTDIPLQDLQNDVVTLVEEESTVDAMEEELISSCSSLTATETTVVVRRAPATATSTKGLARKVLPDVIGLFNWRLWSLWSPSDNNF